MEELNLHIVSEFSKDIVYEFRVEKNESFWFMGNASNCFIVNYVFQVRLIGNGLFEVFYPDTIFYQVKDLDKIQDVLRSTNQLKTKTIFYKLDEVSGSINIENFEELRSSSQHDLKIIQPYLTEEENDNVEFWMEHIFDSLENFEKYILQDLINLYSCEGLDIDDDYHIDLTEKKSFVAKIATKTLKLFNLNFDESSIFKFKSSKPNFYIVSLFKSKEAITAIDYKKSLKGNYQGIDFKKLKNQFISDQLNFDELSDGTYSLYKYHISKDNNMLNLYENKFKISSRKMRKNIYYKIQKVSNNKS